MKHFHSQVINIFVEKYCRKNIADRLLKILRKVLHKKISEKPYLILEFLEISRALQNWTHLGSDFHDKHSIIFMKNVQWQYLEYKL